MTSVSGLVIIVLYLLQAALAALIRTSATFSETPTIGTCPASKVRTVILAPSGSAAASISLWFSGGMAFSPSGTKYVVGMNLYVGYCTSLYQ